METIEMFGSQDAAKLAGCSYRQLDYWARKGVVLPSVEGVRSVKGRSTPGSGHHRRYSIEDVWLLRLVVVLSDFAPLGDVGEWLASVDVRRACRVVQDGGWGAVVLHAGRIEVFSTPQAVYDLIALTRLPVTVVSLSTIVDPS